MPIWQRGSFCGPGPGPEPSLGSLQHRAQLGGERIRPCPGRMRREAGAGLETHPRASWAVTNDMCGVVEAQERGGV